MGNFRELVVWQKSRALVKEVYQITEALPKSENFGLISQIRRAAVSVPANIAEGSARGTDREFNRFILIALGSAAELETLLLLAIDVEHLQETEIEHILADLMEVQLMLRRLSKSLSSQFIREAVAIYGDETTD